MLALHLTALLLVVPSEMKALRTLRARYEAGL